ncbi:MAG: MBL fold metallo-hydrolase [Clostridiales bacterium]|jgi:phosphoribosyl 1,2-cyclic phosphodiesterase|nr:MBL fold metallo-hydrolase [Clostridiales bacterium]
MFFVPLFSGSSGNCSVVCSDNGTRVLVDAGLSATAIKCALDKCQISAESISAILITHEHSDHIKGAGILSKQLNIPIYANAAAWDKMTAVRDKIRDCNIRVFETNKDFFISEIGVYPFSIPHDTADPVGFSFFADGKKLSIATDMGHVTREIEEVLAGSDLLLIESNHDVDMVHNSRYPDFLRRRILGNNGHLSNVTCGNLLVKLNAMGVNRVILGHLSQENNTEELALQTVASILRKAEITERQMQLRIAHRDRACGMFEV